MIVSGQKVVDWVMEGETLPTFGKIIGIGVEKEGKIVAGVIFSDYNGANICMHVRSDKSKKWLSREYLNAIFDYAFNVANVTRITGLVSEDNEEAQRFDEHVGFQLETRLKDAHPKGDLLIYRMYRNECRWIRNDHGNVQ